LTVISHNLPADGSNRRFASENISFRVRKDRLGQLRQEAKEKRISVNTLANQIFDSYVNFESSASKADVIPVSKQALMSLLDGYDDEEEIKAKARQVSKKIGKDIVLQLRGKYDFEALLDMFDSWLKATGFPYRKNTDAEEKNRHTFIIQRNMGRKYSVFAAEGIRALFEPMVTKGVESSITDNSIVITVEGRA
jgi:hypothetical protein